MLLLSWAWLSHVQLICCFWCSVASWTHRTRTDWTRLPLHWLSWCTVLWQEINHYSPAFVLVNQVTVMPYVVVMMSTYDVMYVIFLLCFQGDQMVPCAGRDCSTCQCFPAKGAMVSFHNTPNQRIACLWHRLHKTSRLSHDDITTNVHSGIKHCPHMMVPSFPVRTAVIRMQVCVCAAWTSRQLESIVGKHLSDWFHSSVISKKNG